MSANSKIEWTDHTFNPWIGCTKVSPGCAHCYAEQRDKRHLIEPVDHWGKGAPRLRTSPANWRQPLKWNSSVAAVYDRRPRVFCASLADWLDDEVPIEWLADLLALIHATPNLDWLLLTKRPQNWRKRLGEVFDSRRFPANFGYWLDAWVTGDPPNNVWIGTSVEDQKRADERIPLLLKIPAAVRFLSCEPLLGPLYLKLDYCVADADATRSQMIHWAIVGGESGPNARPCNVDWIRGLIGQCRADSVPVFVKQLGKLPYDSAVHLAGDPHFEGWTLVHDDVHGSRWFKYYRPADRKGGDMSEWPEDLRIREFPNIRENSRPFAGNSPSVPSATSAVQSSAVQSS